MSMPLVVWGLKRIKNTVIKTLRQGPVPRHVAFVMDGNRRYARKHHMETAEGHYQGLESLAKVIDRPPARRSWHELTLD
jgi:ditrans,polycis-polyprenyl diphosphate synthase